MQQISPNVYVENGFFACNLTFVTTKEGIVMIDVPMLPTDAVKWREEINKKGQIKYVINTEEHTDHCLNSYFFGGTLITSQVTREKVSQWKVDEVKEKVKRAANRLKGTDSPELSLMELFKVRLADITFSGNLDLYLGDHSFKLFPLVGHSTGGIGIYIPEERVVITTDCVFHHLRTWLGESLPDEWLKSLQKVSELEVDIVIPGHGAPCKKDYLNEQARIIKDWVDVVRVAIDKGISKDEAIEKITSPDPYPKQEGTSVTEDVLHKNIITRLYQLYSK